MEYTVEMCILTWERGEHVSHSDSVQKRVSIYQLCINISSKVGA